MAQATVAARRSRPRSHPRDTGSGRLELFLLPCDPEDQCGRRHYRAIHRPGLGFAVSGGQRVAEIVATEGSVRGIGCNGDHNGGGSWLRQIASGYHRRRCRNAGSIFLRLLQHWRTYFAGAL